jgi:hypothetical protein
MRNKVVVKGVAMDKSSGFQADNFHHVYLIVNEAEHEPKNSLLQCILLHKSEPFNYESSRTWKVYFYHFIPFWSSKYCISFPSLRAV